MKKIIGYLSSWSLFWIGHVISYLVSLFANIEGFCMTRSANIQDWSKCNGPWD